MVGEQAMGICTKIIGLFIAAMGVQSIFTGTLNWFQANIDTVTNAVMMLV